MQVPGRIGLPIFGETALNFYMDPITFLSNHFERDKSKIFTCRFLNKPTVFVCSNVAVGEVLKNANGVLEMGYEQFLGKVLGHNILFSPDVEANFYRQAVRQLMSQELLSVYESILQRVLDVRLKTLVPGKPFCVYNFFKETFTEMSLSVFLGIDCNEDKELAETLKSLTTTHWHGFIALPLDVKIPGMMGSSTFSKALQAKERLLEIIDSRKNEATDGLPYCLKTVPEMNGTDVNHHLLLFASALVPKVLASVCTSVCLEAGDQSKLEWQRRAYQDDAFLELLVLEAMRLHPPLLGGRRIAKQDCVIGGYAIPKGQAIVFMTYSAHRDPCVFDQPDQFIPDRWEIDPSLKDKLFVYGLGPRACVGQELASLFIKTALKGLFSAFTVDVPMNQDFSRKQMPVSRPKQNVTAMLKKNSRA